MIGDSILLGSLAMYDQDDIDYAKEIEEEISIVEKRLARIRRNIKPKVFQAIEFELYHSGCHGVEIVGIGEVKGKRMKASSYFGESSAVRHVYSNVSSCSHLETWCGDLFIPIGLGRYVRLSIHG